MKNSTAIFLLILSVGLFYTFTSPMYGQVKELSATSDEYKNVLDNISNIIETRDKLQVDYNSISRAEIERLSKVLPANVDTVRLALDLDAIASRYGISISNVSIDTQSEQAATQVTLTDHEPPYQSTLVSVSLVSSYENFKNFIQDLEKSLRIMDVRTVNFMVAESGLYKHEILIETYWVK